MVDFKKIMRMTPAQRQAARDAADAAFKAAWIVRAQQRCEDVRRLASHFQQMTVWERQFMTSLIAKLDQTDDSGWCVGGKLSELSDLQVKAFNSILAKYPPTSSDGSAEQADPSCAAARQAPDTNESEESESSEPHANHASSSAIERMAGHF